MIVPDVQGFQVATGAVYSYYEFWQPRADRLTDEQWWEMIENDDLPPRPFWVQEYSGCEQSTLSSASPQLLLVVGLGLWRRLLPRLRSNLPTAWR